MTAVERYRLSFTFGALLLEEATIATPLYLDGRDGRAVRRTLLADNLLASRTRASAVRTTREVVQRLACLHHEELRFISTAPGPDRGHLMWAAMCRRYDFVAEFAEEVLRDRLLTGVLRLDKDDFERFVASKSLWHDELNTLAPSTLRKLRTNLYLAMREAGFLTSSGEVVPALLSREVTDLLDARVPSELRLFPVPAMNGRRSA